MMKKNRTDPLIFKTLDTLFFKESVLFLVNVSIEKTIVLDFQLFEDVLGAK